MGDRIDDIAALSVEVAELENLKASRMLAVYCGLHIPAVIESDDDIIGLDELSIAARYIPAEHHQLLIRLLEGLERREFEGKRLTRVMVFQPPGTAKSTYGSVLFPAWYLGRNPTHCVIQGSYNDNLASRFGRRARNTFASDVHRDVFGIGLSSDQKAAGSWETELGGEYFTFGMNAGVTGRRADLIVLDDIIRGRKDADSVTVRDSTWETYLADVRTRMKPNAAILAIGTRWHEDDPSGRILPESWAGKSGWVTARDGEEWYVLSLAAVIEDAEDKKNDPLHRKIGEHIWPEWFTLEHFAQERRTQGPRNWYALFQQRPSANDGNILLRSYWRLWPQPKMPECDFIISVYDTAFEEGEENDFSARTSWGVFWFEEPIDPEAVAKKKKERPKWWTEKSKGGRFCAIMLEAWQERVAFPELRKLAKADYDKRRPDRVLIEKKASGHSLIQELRRSNIPVIAIDADRSKILRAHAAAVPMEQGCVWYPDRDWARAVIKHCADFPNGLHDDDVDTVVHALMFLRRTFHLETRDQMELDEFDATLDDTRDTSDRGRQRLF